MNSNFLRTRWSAIGAAIAVSLGAGGIGLVSATSPSDAVAYVPVEPCRVSDTRAGDFNVGPKSTPIGSNETMTVDAHGDNGECTGIPTTATGLQLNVTAIGPSAATVLTIWGSGDRPNASALNPTPGQPPTPNAVTTGVTGSGQFNVWNFDGSVNVAIDIVGYYTDHNHDDRYYTEAEVDAALGTKANTGDTYTKAEVDAAVASAIEASKPLYDSISASCGFICGYTDAGLEIADLTIDAPRAGVIKANGLVAVFRGSGNPDVRSVCWLQLNGSSASKNDTSTRDDITGSIDYDVQSVIGQFEVNAGSNTVSLHCENSTNTDVILLGDWALDLTYIPA